MATSHGERALILLGAGTAARRQAISGQVGALLADVEWPRLTAALRSRRLLPALGPRILELADGHPTDGFADAVAEALDAGRRQGAVLQLVSLRLIAALAEAGIRSTPLKGPLLGERIYGDPGRRLSNDIDLLVAPQQLRAAVEVARGFGYAAPGDYVDRDGFPQLHFALVHERDELPPLELHWRVHWYERAFAPERLLSPDLDPFGLWRPALADELAALLLFYARDGFIDLRLAADLSAWWDSFGAELRQGALEEPLRAYPALSRAISAAALAAEKTVGLPAMPQLLARPDRGLRTSLAVRLANPHPHGSEPQLYAEMGLLDGLLAPPGGLRAFVRRQLLPPHEVLDAQDRRVPKRRLRSSLGRSVRALVRCGVIGRYGLAMIRLLRSPAAER